MSGTGIKLLLQKSFESWRWMWMKVATILKQYTHGKIIANMMSNLVIAVLSSVVKNSFSAFAEILPAENNMKQNLRKARNSSRLLLIIFRVLPTRSCFQILTLLPRDFIEVQLKKSPGITSKNFQQRKTGTTSFIRMTSVASRPFETDFRKILTLRQLLNTGVLQKMNRYIG